jgi:hypothetical protein
MVSMQTENRSRDVQSKLLLDRRIVCREVTDWGALGEASKRSRANDCGFAVSPLHVPTFSILLRVPPSIKSSSFRVMPM